MRIDTGNSRIYLVDGEAGRRRPRWAVRALAHLAFTLAVAVAAALLVLNVAAWRGRLAGGEAPGPAPQGESTAFVPQVGGAENVLRSQTTP